MESTFQRSYLGIQRVFVGELPRVSCFYLVTISSISCNLSRLYKRNVKNPLPILWTTLECVCLTRFLVHYLTQGFKSRDEISLRGKGYNTPGVMVAKTSHVIICIAKHPCLANLDVHSLKQVFIDRLLVLLRWYVFEPKNPNFECHLKYLVHAMCKLRCKTVFYTSVTHRGWTQIQHLKVSSKFEFDFEFQSLIQAFQFKVEFKWGDYKKLFSLVNLLKQ
jgi:hypothetical protein